MTEYEVLLSITNNCNLQCRHCYESAGPGGKTMSEQDIDRVIENLPSALFSLSLTGGEVFTRKKELRHALEQIKRNRERILSRGYLSVQTNGSWVKDEESAYRTMKEFDEAGVDFLIFTSIDKYHQEQGIDRIKLDSYDKKSIVSKALQRLSDEGIFAGRRRHLSLNNSKELLDIMPVGRAKQLPKNEKRTHSQCDVKTQYFNQSFPKQVSINHEGIVHPCCWQVTPALGSAIEKPVEQLVAEAYKNPLFSALFGGGLRWTAKKLGVYREEDEDIYSANPCSICEEVFSAFKEAGK